jgi:hypothetical protein
MKLYIDYILTLYVRTTFFMQSSKDRYHLLCNEGVPPIDADCILGLLANLTESGYTDPTRIKQLVTLIMDNRLEYRKLGNGFLSLATDNHKEGKPKIEEGTVVLLSCALLCMNSDAKTIMCEFLRSRGVNEVARALSTDSLLDLSRECANARQKECVHQKECQLFLVFLGSYPDAYIKRMPGTPPAQMYTLQRALTNALVSGIISKTFLVRIEGDRVFSLNDMAQLLLEGLSEKKDDGCPRSI